MPTFRLVTTKGEDLGPLRVAATTWAPGDRIPWGRETLEVVELRDAAPGQSEGTLVVKHA